MYIMHNNEKYYISKSDNGINIILDEYDEIYFVLENGDRMFTYFYINNKECNLKIAHYNAKINNTIKYIDDETFIPIRKFITDHLECSSCDIDDTTPISFWNTFDSIKPPENAREITLFVLIPNNNKDHIINILHDNVKQYVVDDIVLIIAKTSELDMDNLYQEIVSYTPIDNAVVDMYHYVEYVEKN